MSEGPPGPAAEAIPLREAYASIWKWYRDNVVEVTWQRDDYATASAALISHLPDPEHATDLEIRAVFMEVMSGLLEWGINLSDGNLTMANYVKRSLEPLGLHWELPDSELGPLKKSPLWPHLSRERREAAEPPRERARLADTREPRKKMRGVYLGCAESQTPWWDRLSRRLEARGMPVVSPDWTPAEPEETFWDLVAAGLEDAVQIVLILSQDYLDSRVGAREVGLVLDAARSRRVPLDVLVAAPCNLPGDRGLPEPFHRGTLQELDGQAAESILDALVDEIAERQRHPPRTAPNPASGRIMSTKAAPAKDQPIAPRPSLKVVGPGFDPDATEGADLLGIDEEVKALASLVASSQTKPPLAIGLFGEWGSGKTFFMRKMKARVEAIAVAARASGEPQERLGYHRNIVQIEFNAWHYAEGNLWASLVEHIFANLALAGAPKGETEDGKALRQDILARLHIAEDLRREAEQRLNALEAARAVAEQRLDEAKAASQAKATALAKEAAQDVLAGIRAVAVREDQEALFRDLGIPEEALRSGRAMYAATEELRGVGARTRAQVTFLWNSLRRPGPFAGALVVFAAVPAMAVVAPWILVPVMGAGADTALATVGAQAAAGLAGATTWLRAQTSRASGALQTLEGLGAGLRKQVEEAEGQKAERLAALQAKVEVAREERTEALRTVAKMDTEAAALKAQLQDTDPGRLLARFVKDRAECDDYRKHLGIVAVIRKDFEKLARLLPEASTEGPAAAERPEPPIHRIILYIDDLDRCPPDKVVDVLQAIHMLLAFRLFVVVVGVDARWVSRALSEEYEWLDQTEQAGPAGASAAPGAHASPLDYLEKIFQIPFWVRPMDVEGCERMLDGLVEVDTRGNAPVLRGAALRRMPPAELERGSASPSGEPFPAKGSVQGSAGPVASGGSRGPRRSQSNPTPEIIDLNPAQLVLRAEELEFMRALSPILARSPRTLKRFVNCYRLIRAGIPASRLPAFLGEGGQLREFRATQFLLALTTGSPDIAAELRPALLGAKNDVAEVLDRMKRARDQQLASPEWTRLLQWMDDHAKDYPEIADVEFLRRVAGPAFRHSFRIGFHDDGGSRRQGQGPPPANTRAEQAPRASAVLPPSASE